jgi:hypothetical protein
MNLGTIFKLKCVRVLHIVKKCAQDTLIKEESISLAKTAKKKRIVSVSNRSTVITGILCIIVCCLFLAVFPFFKTKFLPVAGLFTVTSWIWNVAIQTTDLKTTAHLLP